MTALRFQTGSAGWGRGHQTSLPSLRGKFDGFAVQDTSIFMLKGAVRGLKINEAESRHNLDTHTPWQQANHAKLYADLLSIRRAWDGEEAGSHIGRV